MPLPSPPHPMLSPRDHVLFSPDCYATTQETRHGMQRHASLLGIAKAKLDLTCQVFSVGKGVSSLRVATWDSRSRGVRSDFGHYRAWQHARTALLR